MVLQQGDKAPQFKLPNQNGDLVSLKDFKGKKVALYFYPKDNTSTCTVQACNMRDNYSALTDKGIIVLGVSPDGVGSHKKFETKHELPFVLLADEQHKLVQSYGVWAEKSLYGRKYMGVLRTTFLINEKGKIDHIIEKVKSKEHADQILKLWQLA